MSFVIIYRKRCDRENGLSHVALGARSYFVP